MNNVSVRVPGIIQHSPHIRVIKGGRSKETIKEDKSREEEPTKDGAVLAQVIMQFLPPPSYRDKERDGPLIPKSRQS